MTLCSGPCLPHCYRCSASVGLLAYASLAYVGACVGYLLLTRNAGTPFYDSLTVEQRALKRRSAERRGNAFALSLLASAAGLAVWRPLAREGGEVRIPQKK